MVAAPSAHNRGHDRLFPRRGHGHALRRHFDRCASLCGYSPGPHPQSAIAAHPANALARLAFLWLFPRSCHARERPRRRRAIRRRRIVVGGIHQALARRLPLPPSGGHWQLLPHGPPLVHPLFAPQSRFPPHLHHRAQFQALPHPRIPAHPALLVLRSYTSHRLCPLDSGAALVRPVRSIALLAAAPPLRCHALRVVLGPLLPRVFLHLQIQAPRLYPPRRPTHRPASLESVFAPSPATGEGIPVDAYNRRHCVHSASAVVQVRAHWHVIAIPSRPSCGNRSGLIAAWNRNFPLWHKKNRYAALVCPGFALRNSNTRASSYLQPRRTPVHALGSLSENTRARIVRCSYTAAADLHIRDAPRPTVRPQFLSASGDSDMGSRPSERGLLDLE